MFGYKDGDTGEGIGIGKKEKQEESIKQEIFTSPVKGKVMDLKDVNDEVFAQGILGKGIAVIPADGNVYAPCDGVVATLFPTYHAIGILTKSNAELLIHIGIDTVQLNGEGFTPHIAQGDRVKKGQLLVSFDRTLLKEREYDDTVIVLVTNAGTFLDVVCTKAAEADNDKELIAVVV